MKDTSIFQGWRELGDFRFESTGCRIWRTYMRTQNEFVFIGNVRMSERVTNERLHAAALAILEK